MQVNKYDLTVFGATGFTGRLISDHLYREYGIGNKLNWAIAGRNIKKLKTINDEISGGKIPMIIADVEESPTLDVMCQESKVVCSTVGPYSKYGSEVIAACVRNSSHYCDLSGEVPWMKRMIQQYHEKAKDKKLRIVHSCGFDSIPSDMGVYFLQKKAHEREGAFFPHIKTGVKAAKGGLSGGTFASFQEVWKEASNDIEVYKILKDPYALNPEQQKPDIPQKDLNSVDFDEHFQSWKSPFLMATINTRIVRRGAALRDHLYGKDFQYEEFSLTGKGLKGRLKAYAFSLPLWLMTKVSPQSWINKIVDRLTPDPGEGPSKEKRENGFWVFEIMGIENDIPTMKVRITGDKDPGYGSTSKMLAEASVCLALDDLPDIYGSLTPSVAMGDQLLNRLQKNAGISFELKEV